jgi:oxygen-independent coproporphyrinogen-3 oxidase
MRIEDPGRSADCSSIPHSEFRIPNSPWLVPRTGYVHVPFCGHKCGYCDFAVAAGRDHMIDLYVEAVGVELSRLGTPRPVESLFVGGGTPTYLSPTQLDRMLGTVRHWLPLPAGAEFSVESTPDSLDDERGRVLAAHGVSRLSVGVQSFRADTLQALDRRHGVEQIGRALGVARRFVREVSLDLIFAAPGQTLADWQADLAAAVSLNPDHVSTYGLTYETGTPLWKARRRGTVATVAEDDELAMYLHALDSLTTAGFEQYEVSNFARPGRRSAHNQRYWANEAYYGVGLGAARYVGGERAVNTRDLDKYIRTVLAGGDPTQSRETLSPPERAAETLATQLRRLDGIDRPAFREQTGFELDAVAGPRLAAFVAEGLLTDDGRRVRLTRRGLCVADGLVAEFLAADRPTRPASPPPPT